MEINGREITFKRTVWATFAVASLCPDNDPNKIDEVLKTNFVDGNMAAASFTCILSEGAERLKAFEAANHGETYEMRPLLMEEIMNLPDFEIFKDLFKGAVDAWREGMETTVKGEPPVSKKKSKKAKSN